MNDPWIEDRYGLGKISGGSRGARYGTVQSLQSPTNTPNTARHPQRRYPATRDVRAPYRGYIAASCVPSNFSENQKGLNFLRARCVRVL